MPLESHYRSVITNLKEIIFQTDLQGHITQLNPAWTTVTGFSEQEGLGCSLLSYIHPEDQGEAQQQLQLLWLGAVNECRFQARCLNRDQRISWIDLYACATQDHHGNLAGITGSITNITEYKALEQRLSVERAVTEVLAEVVSLSEAMPKLLKAICQSLDWEYAEIWMPIQAKAPPQCVESWCRTLVPTSGSQTPAGGSDISAQTAIASPIFALGTRFIEQIWAGDGLTWLTKLAPEPRSNCPMRSAPTRTALSMPIQDGHELLGVMLFFKRAYHPIDEPLLKRLEVIGSQIGEFVMRTRAEKQLRYQHALLQSELQQAADYVRTLLPAPSTQGVAIAHQFIPSNQLGGDAFDYYWLDQDHLALYLLDVSGHGIRSTLLSVGVLNLMRNQSLPQTDFYQPQSVLTGLNRTFQMNDTGEDYFTIWYGVYNRIQRTLSYASAGHPPALLFSDNDTVQPLHSGGLAIGMFPSVTYQQETCPVGLNSTLYLFSDGVYEIVTATGQRWEFSQFVELIKHYQQQPTRNLEQILANVTRIQGQATLEDDYSLIQAEFIA